MQQSFELDDTNPLTMKHLAEHFFFTGDAELAESLCRRALKFCERLERPETSDLPSFRREMYLLRSDLTFIMGKILHEREDYDGAMSFYFQTVKINPGNFAAQFCLAKIHYLNSSFNAVEESLAKILQD